MAPFAQAGRQEGAQFFALLTLPPFQLSPGTALANCYAFATFATLANYCAFLTQLVIVIHVFLAGSQIESSGISLFEILLKILNFEELFAAKGMNFYSHIYCLQ